VRCLWKGPSVSLARARHKPRTQRAARQGASVTRSHGLPGGLRKRQAGYSPRLVVESGAALTGSRWSWLQLGHAAPTAAPLEVGDAFGPSGALGGRNCSEARTSVRVEGQRLKRTVGTVRVVSAREMQEQSGTRDNKLVAETGKRCLPSVGQRRFGAAGDG